MVNDELVAQMGPPIQSGLTSAPPFADPTNGVASAVTNANTTTSTTTSASSNTMMLTREELKELSTIDRYID